MMKGEVLYTPVLLLAFNRPEQTRQVFNSIREAQPQKLYVAVDAPREGREDDIVNCEEVKKIVQSVDWPCETHYWFRDKNLGCSRSGYLAWDWVFQSEDRMIFIEDDGLATKSAFFFVQDMLERYKDDTRVAYVGAVNHKFQYGDASYFFSRYPDSTYFMGTWKRVHQLFEYNLDSFPTTCKQDSYKQSFWGGVEKQIQERIFKYYIARLHSEYPSNSYDIQMTYLSYKYNMYSIYPNINMVSNIGTESGANHCNQSNSKHVKEFGYRPRFDMQDIKYCDNVSVDIEFEKVFFKQRTLWGKSVFRVWAKFFLLQYFGRIYYRYIKPILYKMKAR